MNRYFIPRSQYVIIKVVTHNDIVNLENKLFSNDILLIGQCLKDYSLFDSRIPIVESINTKIELILFIIDSSKYL